MLMRVFKYAIRQGMRDTNPLENISPLPEPRRKRYITDTELLWLLNAAPPMIQVLIRLGAITGQRISDLLNLEWSAVSDETLFLTIEDYPEELDETFDELTLENEEEIRAALAGKKGLQTGRQDVPGVLFYPSKTRKTTGKKVPIAMSDQLRDTLAFAKSLRTEPSVYVIRKRNGERYQYEGARSAWLRTIARAQRNYFIECGEQARVPVNGYLSNIHFHDLKRKSLTDADNQGKDAQKLGGHASRRMTERYLEEVEGAPRDWIEPPKMPF